jgi:type IX secretion system PorP/SprF family membrane protein
MTRKIVISALLILTFVWNTNAQLQVGQGLNDFCNRLPEIHNFAFIPLTSVPAVSLIGGSRMDGFGRHPMQASLLCSGFLIDRLSAGLKVNYEHLGLLSKTDVQVGLCYYVFLKKDRATPELKADGTLKDNSTGDKFSFFLGGHFIQDKLNRNDIVVLNANDPTLANISDFAPNANASAGIAFLRENTYYAGLSAYQLFSSRSSYQNPEWKNIKRIHFYAQGSYTFHVAKKDLLDLEALGVLAFVDFHAYEWELGAEFKIKKMFSVGAAYRQSVSLGYRANGLMKFDVGIVAQSWNFGYGFSYGAWVDAAKYTYKGINNMIFVRKVFNEGRRSNK